MSYFASLRSSSLFGLLKDNRPVTTDSSNAVQNPDGYVFWKDHAYLSGYLAARKNPDSALLDYATLSNDELKMLEQAGIDLMHPAYPHQDIVGIIKAELLA